jgi:hypothetical protein
MRITQTIALVAALTSVGTASAQPLEVKKPSGPGIRLSESLVLHPSVGVKSGWVSNLFFEENDPVAAAVLYATAGLHVATLSAQRLALGEFSNAQPKIEFSFGGGLRYQEYLTNNDSAQDQRDVAAHADLDFAAFPYGPVRFDLEDHFVRHVRPRNFEDSGNLNRDINDLHASIIIQPGGRALQVLMGYENTIDVFESNHAQFADRIQHRARLRFDWSFLPFTQLFLEGSLGFFDGLGEDSAKVKSMPLRIQTGLNTAITPTFTLRARAGFAKGNYDEGEDYSAPIGGIDLGWEYRPLGRIELGYYYDYRDSINANFYSEHAGRLAISQGIGRCVATLAAAGYLRRYEGIPTFLMPATGETERNDKIGELSADLNFFLNEWLVLSASYQVAAVDSDIVYMFGGVTDDPKYVRQDATLGLEIRY